MSEWMRHTHTSILYINNKYKVDYNYYNLILKFKNIMKKNNFQNISDFKEKKNNLNWLFFLCEEDFGGGF